MYKPTTIALIDQMNDCSFAVEIYDASQIELAKELMHAGLSAWYEAAHENIEDDEYFTAEEKSAMYNDGYAEPALELLERYGIEHKLIELDYDNNGTPLVDEAFAY